MSQGVTNERLLFVDISRCMGCRSCEIACAVAHSQSKDLVEAMEEEPRPTSRVSVEAAEDSAVPLQCRHCEDAPCVTVCVTNALEKLGPNLPVLVKEELCIGCRFCVMVCPFGVITMGRDGKAALKCDLCIERLEAGDDPACVSACPTKALRFLPPNEVAAMKRRSTAAAMKDADAKAALVREKA